MAPGVRQRAVVVLNRVGISGGLNRRQIEDALKMKVDVAIPDLPRQLGQAATMGEPAVTSSQAFRAAIVELAKQIGFISMPDAAACGTGRCAGWQEPPVVAVRAGQVSATHSVGFGRRRPEPVEAEPAPPVAVVEATGSGLASDAIIELRNLCLARLEPAAVAAMPQERLTVDVERLLSEIATDRRIQLNAREQRALAGELVHDILGLGPLEPLLEDDTINDIMVNGPNRTFVERGGKLVLSNVKFRDTQHLANICQRIASAVGRRIDESSPMVDARLLDGSRVNIVFPPLALDGPYVSIRKFSKKSIDFTKLIEFKALTLPVAQVLEIAALCRLNVIISGGTGSGKTTLMNAMSRMIGHGERVVTVEDAAELQLQQPHVVRLETRPASLEGKRRGHAARSGAQRAAHAPRPHHHRRGARRRGVRHAAGDEHRPRRRRCRRSTPTTRATR